MNDRLFDAVTTAVASTPTRRQALRLLSGSVLGCLLTGGQLPTAAKKHKHKKKHRGSPPSPPSPPVSPPPPPPGACQIDADCSGSPATPLCCTDTGVATCQVCCVADNRGCQDNFFCIDGGTICI
jgi:hypothetical protein